MVPLFTKPGYLTKEYFAGRRAAHLNPISMYIFISILFFFLFTANTNINKKGIIDENATAAETEEKKAEAKEVIGDVRKAIAENSAAGKLNTAAGNMPDKAAAYSYTILNNAEAAFDTGSRRANEAIIYTNPAEKEIVQAEAPAPEIPGLAAAEINIPVAQSLKTRFRNVMDDDLSSELFKNKLVSHLPKVMFILLPLFALILKLVNRRSSKYYVEHLVYSIHVHSFLFLFISILILLSWLLPFLSDWLQLLGVVVSLWYIYRSMRNIYRSTRWRTIYKFFLLFIAYGFLLTMSGIIVVVATLYTI